MKFQDQMKNLESKRIVTNLSCHPKFPGFFFNLGNIKKIGGIRIYENFSKYRFRIFFKEGRPIIHKVPFVKTQKDFKHMYIMGNLCLFHPSEFNWNETPYLDEYIIPWIYTWQLFYNEWKRTDNWPGPEFPHHNK